MSGTVAKQDKMRQILILKNDKKNKTKQQKTSWEYQARAFPKFMQSS